MSVCVGGKNEWPVVSRRRGGDTKLRRRGYLTPAQSFSLSDLLTFFAAYFLPLRRSVVGNFRSCECIFFAVVVIQERMMGARIIKC